MRFPSILIIAATLALSSSQAVFTGIYGILKHAPLPAGQLPNLAAQYGIPTGSTSPVLDTSFWRVLRRMHAQDSSVAKNHWQFLQAVYYDAGGRQQSYHINCYAGGFPNLKWERDGIMAQFPPAQQAPRDSTLTLAEHLRYLRLLSPAIASPANYTVVVHWSRFMTRQSRRLIQAVRRNVVLAPAGMRVNMVFVNTDDFYYLTYQRDDQRRAAAQQKSPAY